MPASNFSSCPQKGSTHLLLFGDASDSPHASLQALYREARNSKQLDLYLREASEALRDGIAREPSTASCYRPSSSLLYLSTQHEAGGRKNAALSFALTTATQLGWLIVEMEREVLPDSRIASERVLLGFCTGMLAALVAAYAPTLCDLLKVAPRMSCLSFEIGMSVVKRSGLVEQTEESWARFVVRVPQEHVQNALDNFHSNKRISVHRQAYISAILPTSITVSAPPSTLKGLLDEVPLLTRSRASIIPGAVALHCPNLGMPPLYRILELCPEPDRKLPPQTSILSPSSGEYLPKEWTLKDALREALVEIFQRPLCWPSAEQKLMWLNQHSEITLSIIGTSHITKSLTKTITPKQIYSIGDDSLRNISAGAESTVHKHDVAVIGMAVRLPGANDLQAFWDVLEKGRDMHSKVPLDRYDADRYYDPTGAKKNTALSPFGCFADCVSLFDAPLFNMSPREAERTDPGQRLLLLTAYEALEMAGYQQDRTPSMHRTRIGTFFGQSGDDYREGSLNQKIDPFYVTGGNRAFGPGRLSWYFGWEGPSYSIDTACSSSLTSIQLAVRAIQTGDCDTALAGGSNIITNPAWSAGLSRGGFLSPTGGCKTFDEEADGYCRADGVGTVVLKRLVNAIAENDNVLGVIKAAQTNHSTKAPSITQPHAETQEHLFREVLSKAYLNPHDIDYVEIHGTGTQAGDIIEPLAVMNVFGERRKGPLYIGTVKPNIGHSEASSGVSSLIKALLMLRQSKIPPHIGIKNRLNPKMPDLASRKILITEDLLPFPEITGSSRKRSILINNFNATAGNTCVILQEHLNSLKTVDDPRDSHLVVVSAKSPKSLVSNLKRLSQFLGSHPSTRLCDLAYTTTARRVLHRRRKTFIATSTDELLTALNMEIQNPSSSDAVTPPRVVFVFTGQGASYAGMGQMLFSHFAVFQNTVNEADAICLSLGLPSIKNVICDPTTDLSTGETLLLQLALTALQLALTNLWKSWGLLPDAVIGHSLGEYAALCVSEVLSVTDMFYLLGHRANLINSHCVPGILGMLSIGQSSAEVQATVSRLRLRSCNVACYNSSTQTVVSGELEELETLKSSLPHTIRLSSKILNMPFAYHSEQMQPILVDYEAIAKTIAYAKPRIPYASSLLGRVVTEQGIVNARYMVRQTREPVRFLQATEACSAYLEQSGRAIWVELGPKSLCLPMINANLAVSHNLLLPSMVPKDSLWSTFSKSLKKAIETGVNVRWTEYHRPFEAYLNFIELPSYAFDLESYWLPYKGDWMLHEEVNTTPARPALPLNSSLIHRVLSVADNNGQLTIKFESDIQEHSFREVIGGHLVNGRCICPSAAFAEMAFAVATYMWRYGNPDLDVLAIELAEMRNARPVELLPFGSNQLMTISATMSKGTTQLKLAFQTESTEVANCSVLYGDSTIWKTGWSKQAYLYQDRIDRMQRNKDINCLQTALVYKTFANFVEYSGKYQAIQKAHVDYELSEATASLSFQPNTATPGFVYSSYWIDSLSHIAGWVLNSSPLAQTDTVYLLTGWDSMRIAGPLTESGTYQAYVRMQKENDHGLWTGEVHVFDNNTTIAVFSGIKFKAMKRAHVEVLFVQSIPANNTLQPLNANKATYNVIARNAKPPKVQEVLLTPQRDLAHQFREILATELGVEANEIGVDTLFTNIGLDSLKSLGILDAIRSELKMEVPPSFFFQYPTFADVEQYLGLGNEQNPGTKSVVRRSSAESLDLSDSVYSSNHLLSSYSTGRATGGTSPIPSQDGIDISEKTTTSPQSSAEILSATHVVIHKPNNHTQKNIFSFPGGFGTGSTYALLPRLHDEVAFYALNSAFLDDTARFNVSLEDYASLYVDEIRKLQPNGPYSIAGYSVGGVVAYEAVRQMIEYGDQVDELYLIDSACPLVVPPLPEQLIDFFDSIDRFSGGESQESQNKAKSMATPHIRKTLACLRKYQPLYMKYEKAPRTTLFRVRDGVNKHNTMSRPKVTPEEDVGLDWILNDRVEDPHIAVGWEDLVGRDNFSIVHVDGNHFSVMVEPYINQLADELRPLVKIQKKI